MLTAILTCLAIASATLHIHAEYRGLRQRVYLFKPLTMLLILAIAAQAGGPGVSLYEGAVLAGLLCSLAGDVLLMLPSDRFIAGLASFLAAHVCYTAAFVSGSGFGVSAWLLAPPLVYGAVLLRVLWPHLGKMRLPVLAYAAAILVMAWQAWEWWSQTGRSAALMAALGATLFVISDSALAVNRFRGRFRHAPALILGTYFAAQWLIACSTHQGPGR